MARSSNNRPRWPKTRPAPGFRGVYINLDRDLVRRKKIEAQIRNLGWGASYLRLPAVDGRKLRVRKAMVSPAVMGCYRSHELALKLAAEADTPVHVVEDDARLTEHIGAFALQAEQSGLLATYDMLFLDMWIDPVWTELSAYEELYRGGVVHRQSHGGYDGLPIRNLRGTRVGTGRSYVVSPRGAEKISSILTPGNVVSSAFDNRINDLVQEGRMTAGVVVPFLTGGDLDTGFASNIQGIGEEQLTVFELFRMAFTIDVDPRIEVFPMLDRLRATRRYPGLDEFRHLIATRPL